MKRMAMVNGLLAALAAVLLVTPGFGAGLGISDAPQWVNTGTTYTNLQGSRLFYGVGSAPTVGDPGLQRTMAESSARREMSRMVSSYLDALIGEAGSGDTAAKPQLRNLAKAAVAEAQLVARWRDRRTGLLFSLVQLDVEALKSIAAASSDLGAELQARIRSRADDTFDRLAQKSR